MTGQKGHCHIQLHPLQFTFGTSLGSNWEGLLRAVYRGLPGWNLELDLHFIQQGKNEGGINFGSDPRVINTSRQSDYNNELLQGLKLNTQFMRLYASYAIWPNYQLFGPITEKSLPVN